jgi:hypothetical protein
MRNHQKRLARGVPYSTHFASIGCVVLTVLLSSCSNNTTVQRQAQQADGQVLATQYSIVCVIHGDGDYIYHDTSGNEYNADEEALAGAKRVAMQNPRAEVFIFHQRSKKHFLFFFPLHDGEFFYYRNGSLVANELYWRDQEQSHFDPELEFYRRFRKENQPEMMSIFLYCGHEIPEFNGAGYHASYPDQVFTVHDFSDGLKVFTRDFARFDLMILATCFGGTPYTISTLGSFARYIVASPENLHLSYFDIHSLERLDLSLRNGEVSAFAKRFAHEAFDRLTKDVQTTVSVAVYDVDRVQEYLHSVYRNYDQELTTIQGKTRDFMPVIEHCDCGDLSAYVMPMMNRGVEILYRPARFGRLKNKQNHSGWECWKEKGFQAAPLQTTEPDLK